MKLPRASVIRLSLIFGIVAAIILNLYFFFSQINMFDPLTDPEMLVKIKIFAGILITLCATGASAVFAWLFLKTRASAAFSLVIGGLLGFLIGGFAFALISSFIYSLAVPSGLAHFVDTNENLNYLSGARIFFLLFPKAFVLGGLFSLFPGSLYGLALGLIWNRKT